MHIGDENNSSKGIKCFRSEENILAAMIQLQNPDGAAADTICEWLEVHSSTVGLHSSECASSSIPSPSPNSFYIFQQSPTNVGKGFRICILV